MDELRQPGRLHVFAPVGFALGFALFLLAPFLVIGLFVLWLVGGFPSAG
jgi:hypothetical protein